jgi:hypothetical protein
VSRGPEANRDTVEFLEEGYQLADVGSGSHSVVNSLQYMIGQIQNIQHAGQYVQNQQGLLNNPAEWETSDKKNFTATYNEFLGKVQAVLGPCDGMIAACQNGIAANQRVLQAAGEL